MKTNEFLKAVNAYLDGKANSWQTFLVDDHFDSYTHELEILELYKESEVQMIYERIRSKINKKILLQG